MSGRFAGKVVLVTGGARNIGLAIAERFAAEGAAVAVNSDNEQEAAAAVTALRERGCRAAACPGDVSDPAQAEDLVMRAQRELGGLDVLVNNAAVPMLGRTSLLQLDPGDWDRSFAVNTRGVFLCSTAAARLMPHGSSMVNISSIGATRAHRGCVAYDATKGAVEAATRAIALELAPRGIRVNAVAPGSIANDRFAALSAQEQRTRAAPVPAGRVGTGEDVAGVVAFLASADAAYVTGQVITVDGGLTAQARPAGTDPSLEASSTPHPPSEGHTT